MPQNTDKPSLAVVLCRDCGHWDMESRHTFLDYTGQCRLASDPDWGDAPMVVSDEIQAYDPHLLTRPTFGCVAGKLKATVEPIEKESKHHAT